MIRKIIMWYLGKIVTKECIKHKECYTCPFSAGMARCTANQVLDGLREVGNAKRCD